MAHDSSSGAAAAERTLTSKASSAFLALRAFLSPMKLIILCLAQLIDAINVSSVNVAIPYMAVALNMDEASVTWVLAAYSIAFGSLMLISGRMGDMLGFRNMFLFGLVWFAIWSIVCGVATNANLFIVSRALQGLGAAATIPNGLALITANYEGEARERAIGVFGAASSMGFTVGLIIGGAFTSTIGYQWIFFLSAIVAGFQSLMTFIVIPDDRETNRKLQADVRRRNSVALGAVETAVAAETKPSWRQFDYLGAFLITLAIFFLVFFLTEGSSLGWGAPVNIVFIILCVLFFIVFVAVEYRLKDEALMPLAVWVIPNFAAIFALLIIGAGSLVSLLFWYTQLWQNVRHVSPLQTSIQFLPMGLTVFAITPVVVLAIPKLGPRYMMIISALFQMTGTILAVFIDENMPYWNMPFASMIIVTIGFSILVFTSMLAGLASAPPEWRGVVSALINVALQLGAGIFLAITSAVASSTGNTDVLTATTDELTSAYHNAIWTIFAAFGLQLVLTVLFIRNVPLVLPGSGAPAAAAPAESSSAAEIEMLNV